MGRKSKAVSGPRVRGGSVQGRGFERRTKARLDPVPSPPPRLPTPPSSSSRASSSDPSSSTPSPPRRTQPSPPPPSRVPRTAPSPPPAHSPPYSVQPPVSPDSSDSHSPTRDRRIASRPMTQGRNIDFGFLAREGFTIGDLLQFQGWEFLCSLRLPTYPNLVREFYTNAKVSSRSFTSSVKGIALDLSEQSLATLLRAPCAGSETLPNRDAALRLLFGREEPMHFEEISARDLSIEHRLLHHMIARIILPRIGRFDFVTNKDLAILYHLILREKFNLPATILRVMQETVHKFKSALPYGMFLTLVFRDSGVDLEGESALYLKHYDTYNSNSLKRMKFRKLADGTWTKIDESEAPQPAASRPSRPRVSHPSVHPSSSTPSDLPDIPFHPPTVPPSDIPGPSSGPPAPESSDRQYIWLAPAQVEEIVQRVTSSVLETLVPLIRGSHSVPAAPSAPSDPVTSVPTEAPADSVPAADDPVDPVSVTPDDPPAG